MERFLRDNAKRQAAGVPSARAHTGANFCESSTKPISNSVATASQPLLLLKPTTAPNPIATQNDPPPKRAGGSFVEVLEIPKSRLNLKEAVPLNRQSRSSAQQIPSGVSILRQKSRQIAHRRVDAPRVKRSRHLRQQRMNRTRELPRRCCRRCCRRRDRRDSRRARPAIRRVRRSRPAPRRRSP